MKVAALAAAAAGAALLPGAPPGIGVPLVALLVAAAVAAARPPRAALLYGGIALALCSVAAVRDAGWVVALALATAWLLGSVAVAGPTLAAAAGPFVRLRDAGSLAPGVPQGSAPVLRGSALACLVVVPFGALFWSADAAFAELAGRVPFPDAASLPGRAVAFGLVFAAAAGLALTARRPVRAPAIPAPRTLGFWEWALPLALLDALFLAFVAVQLAVLFGGREHVLETAGLTYAEYAREGFGQLLAAAVLTLAVVGAAVLCAAPRSRRDGIVLRMLLGVLCALTIVVLVSALRRLWLYEEAFGLTRLRFLAEAFSLWLGGLFALLAVAGLSARLRRRLAPVVLVGTGVAVLAFALANPDRTIAERNVERWRATGDVDLVYLGSLSADAAPALAELSPPLRAAAFGELQAALAEPDPWSSLNLSRERARRLLGR